MPPFRCVLSLLFAAACVLLPAPASAQITWDGGGDGTTWFSAANWSTNTVPGPTDDVVIPAGTPAVNIIGSDVSIRSLSVSRPLTIGANRTLNISTTAAATAPVTLGDGATLSRGSWTLSASGTFIFPLACSTPARLSNLTINGDIPNFNGYFRWNNVTLNGTVTSTGFSEITFEGNQTLTGTIANDASASLRLTPFFSGTLTIAPSATVRGGNITFTNSGCVTASNLSVVNNGTINANSPSRSIVFDVGVPFTNNGTVTANPGNLTFASITNAGTITVTSGSATFTGAFNPAQLGVFSNTGSAVISDTADLGGQTWNVQGSWRINGTLQNGTVNLASGTFTFPARCTTPARLRNLTINGDIPGFTGYFRWNNVTLNGTLTATTTANSEITFEGNQTLTGTIAASTTSTLFLSPFSAGTLTIGPSATVRGGNITFSRSGCPGPFAFAVVNNGLINANTASRTITFGADVSVTNSPIGRIAGNAGNFSFASLTNNGTITGNASNFTFVNLTNNGTITLTGGASLFNGTFSPLQLGAFTTTGSYIINGTADLGGQAWNVAGSWQINGTLQNGTVNFGSGTVNFAPFCFAPARLSNLTINSEVLNFTGYTRWNNITLNGTLNATAAAGIAFEGNQTLTGTIAASTTSSVVLAPFSAGTLTIAPSATVRGGTINFSRSACQGAIAFAVVNDGVINANFASGGIIFGEGVLFTNNATVLAGPGFLNVSGGFGGGITNSASGTITGNAADFTFANLNNAGTIALSGGTTTFAGNFNPTQLGVFSNTGSSVINNTADLGGQTWNVLGPWQVFGTIQNGTVNLASGRFSFPPPCNTPARLSNLTINGDIPNFTGYFRWNNVTLNGTVTSTGFSGITFEGNQTLTGTIATFNTANISLTPFSAGTLTIAPSATVRGAVFFSGSGCAGSFAFAVVNNGTINANLASQTVTFNPGVPFTNNGTVRAGPGSVNFGSAPTNYSAAASTLTGGSWRAASGGFLRFPAATTIRTIGPNTSISLEGAAANLFTGSGTASPLAELTTINGGLELLAGRNFTANPVGGTFTNNGTLSLSPGSLFTVNGNFVQSTSVTLRSFISSAASIGTLFATGSVSLAGAVDVQYLGGFAPAACSDSLQILSANNGLGGAFATQRISVPGNLRAGVVYSPSTVTLVSAPRADLVSIGGSPPGDGLLTSDDFVAFINAFAASDLLADICEVGGPPNPPDGLITGDDFVAFVNSFAAGCP